VNDENLVFEVIFDDHKKLLSYDGPIDEAEKRILNEVELFMNKDHREIQKNTENKLSYKIYKTYDYTGDLGHLLDGETSMNSLLESNSRLVWHMTLLDDKDLNEFISFTELNNEIHRGFTSFNKENIAADFYDNEKIIQIINDNKMFEISEFYRVKLIGMGTYLAVFNYEDEFYCINYSTIENEDALKNYEIYTLDELIRYMNKRVEKGIKKQKVYEFIGSYGYK